MFSFIKKKLGWGSAEPETTPANPATPAQAPVSAPVQEAAAEASPQHALRPAGSAPQATPTSGASGAQPPEAVTAAQPLAPSASPAEPARRSWLDKLRNGLRKTGSSIAQVFTGTQIDDALYEELEAALLMADAGVAATEHLLQDLKRRVKEAKATDPSQVKGLLIDAITDLLQPLEKSLEVGEHTPTVIMVAGVNGAGKTTTIGKLTRHLSDAGQRVLLVIADTAGRLATQLHLMDELSKVKRVIGKAMEGAPHEVLLVVDGNTGQNALSQVKAFDQALGLTGVIITKLDGTAKGGVLAAIALWSRERKATVPVYFIGVGEKLEDLQTFQAREFAQALLS